MMNYVDFWFYHVFFFAKCSLEDPVCCCKIHSNHCLCSNFDRAIKCGYHWVTTCSTTYVINKRMKQTREMNGISSIWIKITYAICMPCTYIYIYVYVLRHPTPKKTHTKVNEPLSKGAIFAGRGAESRLQRWSPG